MLLLAALVWGIAFVAQSEGLNYVETFTFNTCRFLLGGAVLIPCIFFMHGRKDSIWQTLSEKEKKEQTRMGIIGGICCGCVLCLASCLQQFGIGQTTVGKMYFLCITESFSIGAGDRLVLMCSVVFSVHILVIDYFSPKADGVVISCVQFFTAGVLACVLMLLFEHPSMSAVIAAAAPILYAGVMSCGVGYTLQVVAQNGVDPTIASLLLSLESVFSVLAGWVILGQKLSGRELFGCALVFAAVLLVQIPTEKLFPCRK